jgi:acetolactate synthase-1/2/3 large subunit
MIVADFIIKIFVKLGIEQSFLVTGGAAMFLNNAIGKEKGLKKKYCNHEQSAAIAAEVYARIKKKPALLNITAGPGVLNALNGVFGAYTDSVPMIIISGQSKKETSLQFHKISGLRQLGDQELKTIEIVKSITKKNILLRNSKNISKIILEAYNQAISGRPGPVWIDIPIDVQSELLSKKEINILKDKRNFIQKKNLKKFNVKKVFSLINSSSKPLVLAGTGVKISSSKKELEKFVKLYKIPIVTAWCHDIIKSHNRLYVGRQGTIGTRSGNFATQNCDLLIVIGSRLNIRQVSYNYKSFAKNSKIIWVDIDKNEFKKNFIKPILKIPIDVKIFLEKMIHYGKNNKIRGFKKWLMWCENVKNKYSPKYEDYREFKDINPYHFIYELFENLNDQDIIVCADATATIVPFQIGKIKKNIDLISNSGSASMGYDLPGALGALCATSKRRVICLAGDGSVMMNLQDLTSLKQYQDRLKIFILNNNGYLSIKQTQKNFFGKEYGASPRSGLNFPNFYKVGKSFGFKSFILKKSNNWKSKLKFILLSQVISFIEVKLATQQQFEPRIKSKKIGKKIYTPQLDDMYPYLPIKELDNIRSTAKIIN